MIEATQSSFQRLSKSLDLKQGTQSVAALAGGFVCNAQLKTTSNPTGTVTRRTRGTSDNVAGQGLTNQASETESHRH